MTRWGCDVERLNRLLRSGLTFYIEPDGGRDPPGPVRGGLLPAPVRARAGCVHRGRAAEGAVATRGVLVMVFEDGRRQTASCSIPIGGSERGRLLAISRGLSECAMALGLGTGVYRGCG